MILAAPDQANVKQHRDDQRHQVKSIHRMAAIDDPGVNNGREGQKEKPKINSSNEW